jgi:hypothetical protein
VRDEKKRSAAGNRTEAEREERRREERKERKGKERRGEERREENIRVQVRVSVVPVPGQLVI